MTVPTLPTSMIYPTARTLPPRQRLPYYSPRSSHLRQPYYNGASLPPPPPGFRPYSFHQKFMGVPPIHTDEQCRDTSLQIFTRQQPPVKQERAPPRAIHVMAMPSYNQNIAAFPPAAPHNWPYADAFANPAANPLHHEPDPYKDDTNIFASMSALDAAAHPTHNISPPPSLFTTTNLSTRTADSLLTPCTHAGPIQIHPHPKHPSLRVP